MPPPPPQRKRRPGNGEYLTMNLPMNVTTVYTYTKLFGVPTNVLA
jgi:hypothetical protein